MRLPFRQRNDFELIERWLVYLLRDLTERRPLAARPEYGGITLTLAKVYRDSEEYEIRLRTWSEKLRVISLHDMSHHPCWRLELSITEHSPRDRKVICRLRTWQHNLTRPRLELPRREAELPPPKASIQGLPRREQRRIRRQYPTYVREATDCLAQMGRDWLELRTWADVEYAAANLGQTAVPDTALSPAEPANPDIDRGLSPIENS
jgi:hypothetical protein